MSSNTSTSSPRGTHCRGEPPLRIDTLIIKKPKNVKIDKNFAQMFRSENICEFKSPGAYLSVKDFYKVMAYANLYTAITAGVEITDITLTFVEAKYPRKLIKRTFGPTPEGSAGI